MERIGIVSQGVQKLGPFDQGTAFFLLMGVGIAIVLWLMVKGKV
jgi:hypothetical protein